MRTDPSVWRPGIPPNNSLQLTRLAYGEDGACLVCRVAVGKSGDAYHNSETQSVVLGP